MALTNHDRVGKALALLRKGLVPFVEREIANAHPGMTPGHATYYYMKTYQGAVQRISDLDAHALLLLIWNAWNAVFNKTLGHAERNYVSELREARNAWAHQRRFSTDDAYRALDSTHRLLTAIAAREADEAEKMKMELLRLRFNEQARHARRQGAQTALKIGAVSSLPAWRNVVEPHPDVSSGRYNLAEFAADLWQVYKGEGSREYLDPAEFFRRTYLTESLRAMLVGAIRRFASGMGDPVIQLQTNFGGGKTHSMLALYHLFSGTSPTRLTGVADLMKEADVNGLPRVNRVVLVGNKLSAGRTDTKPDGTVVRTLWGELAWQLGGKDAYAKVAADDEKGTNPGDALNDLFKIYGPCLILIDEWVAYARQLHDRSDLPAGSFETQFTFAQTLTEAARSAPKCLLVISLPASTKKDGSPHTQADDAEVGGVRGREALNRLNNVIGRVESSWHPATAEEGFAIVRRRLFQPMDQESYKQRDVVARTFGDFYRKHAQEFPLECRDRDYERRMKEAYPIHPEIFDRLYEDWSTLLRFQRTRGVLRLIAAVIHSLWEKGDRSPVILPSLVPVDDNRVRPQLTNYLPDRWDPIIESDVDGPNSLPLRMDGKVSNLGKFNACRRAARTIYLGSAPVKDAARKGMDDRRVKLGCALPGEPVAIFGDAIRRLAGEATYLYQDGTRVWYDTQPTVAKLARDRAARFRREPDEVAAEIRRRVKREAETRGDFHGVHDFPSDPSDVPDETGLRLVILGVDAVYIKGGNSPAEAAARTLLEFRGPTPRLRRNTLVFLAPDKTKLQDLEEAVCLYLAWKSIVQEIETLNLTPFQVKQAQSRVDESDRTVQLRIPEVYQWLLVPVQNAPQNEVEWEAFRLTGGGALAERASRRLRHEELMVTRYGSTLLRRDIDRIPLWEDGDSEDRRDVAVRNLADHYARYIYLQRVQDPTVIIEAVREGIGLLTWSAETFAYAEGYDQEAKRYRGLRAGTTAPPITPDDSGFVVHPRFAKPDQVCDKCRRDPCACVGPSPARAGVVGPPPSPKPKRFHGSISLDPIRAGLVASEIAEEIVSHLLSLTRSKVELTLEIQADVPEGATEHVVRTVTENARTLGFTHHAFEEE